ncbi:hypothetical protein ACIQCJ_16910 [Streptomyces sp. NPDC093221]|uniref:hypothetical protein n=1 Tax=Streptomyces sp. NPDC093221 TaxID=3366032 RepID=UPI00381547BF
MGNPVSTSRHARLGRRRRWSIRLWALGLVIFYAGFVIDLVLGDMTGTSLTLSVTSAVLLTASAIVGVWLTMRRSRQP